ncbi:hypothetical protein EA473_17695 [Natrarchaeobius chitinivorans]|uniref:Uncharacterized protein n=1 Tax=Natrarchaeobius chitinivorans TaxID=1679083 RepID=A0A3N6LQY8_NATCH|nr:hypothetical protein EA473_17695 [Natrarchaeobius chitinivorans]
MTESVHIDLFDSPSVPAVWEIDLALEMYRVTTSVVVTLEDGFRLQRRPKQSGPCTGAASESGNSNVDPNTFVSEAHDDYRRSLRIEPIGVLPLDPSGGSCRGAS